MAYSKAEDLRKRFYGDDSVNGTKIFYGWIRQYLRPEFVVLNLGAGHPANMSPFSSLKGLARQVIGADLSESVLRNPDLDRAIVADGCRLPFPSGHFDLVLSDYTLEHVGNPISFLAEAARVLKPNGSFFFRTPNRYHYTAWVTQWIPFRLHRALANWAQGFSESPYERFPAFYRLNTRKKILSLYRQTGFKNAEVRLLETEPTYLVFHPIPFFLGVAYERLVNHFKLFENLRVNIMGRLER